MKRPKVTKSDLAKMGNISPSSHETAVRFLQEHWPDCSDFIMLAVNVKTLVAEMW